MSSFCTRHDAVPGWGVDSSCLFHDSDFSHHSGSGHRSTCNSHTAPWTEGPGGPAQVHRALDISDLAVRFHYRRGHLLPSLSSPIL